MIPFHPYADLFPLVDGAEFEALVADVASRGLVDKIVLHDGMILDGRNRYRAARAAGLIGDGDTPDDVERIRYFVRFLPEIDGDPLEFAIAKNLIRRHLNEAQRASVAAKLATLRPGRPGGNPANLPGLPTQAAAAQWLSISERALRQAHAVHAAGVPELNRALDRGVIAVSLAERAARLSDELQREVAREAEAGRAAVVRTVVKRAARAAREEQLGRHQQALPDMRYGVILADPEWAFEAWSAETGMDRAPDQHYPTSPTAAIMARPVATIAADDAVLFLWATAPRLPDALAVMSAWGFAYKTHRIWHKLRAGAGRGAGYWFTGEHELLLVGTCGAVPAPATAYGPSLVAAPVGAHSEKPDWAAAMIEALFPSLPKIELNRRGPPRPGWDAWGNEAEEVEETESGDAIDGAAPADVIDPETGEVLEEA